MILRIILRRFLIAILRIDQSRQLLGLRSRRGACPSNQGWTVTPQASGTLGFQWQGGQNYCRTRERTASPYPSERHGAGLPSSMHPYPLLRDSHP